TIGRVQDKTAFGYVERYNEDHNVFGMRKAEKARLALGCTDVKRTTGQHPGGIIVLPHGEEIHTFTPIQHPANDMESPVTTHFDYHSIDHNLLKLDILGKDDPSMVRMLQDLTGVDPMTMPIGVPEVLELFKSTKSLGITPEDIGGTPLGTLGIPEFGTDFAIGMLLDAKPQYVSDLVRIAGLAHGTDVWLGNAQTLIEEGKCTIQTAICTRDDIMLYLIDMGLDPAMSFKIMEAVRKGKVAKGACDTWEDWKTEMRAHNVPEWYIESCNKIKYMFPKAHAAAYVVMGLRIAYFKVYYPKEYYAAYFTVKGSGFDYEKMNVSLPVLRQTIKELKEYVGSNRNATANDKLALRDIRIVEEMMARGVEFAPIDIFKAKATQFTLTEDGRVMPSLNSISGLGDNAAAAIEADAVNGPYLSVEEFIQRTKVSKTNAEQLKALGLLGDLTDTNQMSIFDMMAD
ncbi:MAG: PolC-type DNA polymerase III, partial [Lachnospiraceae bacterium]|nr:PolC-type DNA polymerase III [Candidatus Hippenecus merdae]